MNNKFCNVCGQANLPDSSTCSKCGNSIANLGGQQPIQATQVQRPATPPSHPKTKKKSNTIYWVLGIGSVFLVMFFMLAIVAGAALMIYNTRTSEDIVVTRDADSESKRSTSDKSEPSRDEVNEDLPIAEVDNAQLEAFFRERRAKVGKYSLVSVRSSNDKTIFPNRNAGVEATYRSGTRKIVHRAAIYASNSAAKTDGENYREAIENLDAEIRINKSDRIVYVYRGLTYFAFDNKKGGLHEVSSKSGVDIVKYSAIFFKEE